MGKNNVDANMLSSVLSEIATKIAPGLDTGKAEPLETSVQLFSEAI